MGAAAGIPANKRQPEPEINVTPLVDVVLVLLIIFMVIAPQLEHGERVDLPAVFKPDEKSKSKLDPITITMTVGEKLFLEKEPVTDLATLKARLLEIRNREPERRVVLKGDSTLPYDKMRETFATCQEIGFHGVSLSVSQRGRKGAGDEG